jgi:four helix bundle protein
MENYRNLIAWQKAKALALDVYICTCEFPRAETYGLTSQMRRAAISVPSNIAEGKGRYSPRELVQFLYHARGSLLELETQLEIAHDLGYIEQFTFKRIEAQTRELGRILNGLIHRFQAKPNRLS